MDGLRLDHLHKTFGDTVALSGVTFEVNSGEIVAVLGPSGCGKSTLLALIAGLEEPDRGEIYWNDIPLAGVRPHKRGFGLMFQDFALFPHRDVFGNVAFGLEMMHTPKDEISRRVAETLQLVGLPDFSKLDLGI